MLTEVLQPLAGQDEVEELCSLCSWLMLIVRRKALDEAYVPVLVFQR